MVYLSDYFVKNGYDMAFVNISGKLFYELNEKITYESLNISSQCNNLFERFINIVKRYSCVRSSIKKLTPDVVISLLPETSKYILSLHKRGNFKLITSERNNPELDGNVKLKHKVFVHSDGIVFQTSRAKNWYPESIGKKGVVIHNAVGNDLVYKIPVDIVRKKKISAVGRLSKQKDYPTLLRAFKTVSEYYPEYYLEIFGDGPDEAELKALAENLGVSRKVRFMGAHKDAVLQIADSTCYVMSSIYEGMPNALMEAMAVGLPCVSTDCPNGPAELIVNGENGLLVPVGDVVALAGAIVRMIEEKNFAETCGMNAKKILETHNVEKIAKQYIDYIESVVKRKGKNGKCFNWQKQ